MFSITATPPLRFKVHRREPELIAPSRPTPREFKPLSDIDDQEALRFQIPVIQFFKHNPSMEGMDPVKVIKDAIRETLVYYYPLAGRLREWANGKLVVECNAEGVLFIEADADVSQQAFIDHDQLRPPFPCFDELLFDVPGSGGVLDCPLLLFQVTRLRCGGFIVAIRMNHTMCDGPGIVQFMSAIGEIARGERGPSIPPVWERHILNARDPPRVTCVHREYEWEGGKAVPSVVAPLKDLVQRSFFFGPREISRLRQSISTQLGHCTTFEILTACLWKCRTAALQLDANEEMRLMCIANIRNKLKSLVLPRGYYGNGFVYPAAVATAGDLSQKPLEFVVKLIKKAKEDVTEEYIKSVADLMVTKRRPLFILQGSFIVSDITHSGLQNVDYGWGNAIYSGVAKAGASDIPEVCSFYVPFKNKEGENGIMVPIYLPKLAMGRFVKQLEGMLRVN